MQTKNTSRQAPVPVVHDGIIVSGGVQDLTLNQADGTYTTLTPIGQTGRFVTNPRPQSDFTLTWADGSGLHVQVSGWAGRVDSMQGGLISGWARNLRVPGQDVVVMAFDDSGSVAVASARAAEGGRFVMLLPPELVARRSPRALSIGIVGSDYVLENGQQTLLPFSGRENTITKALKRPTHDLAIRIKISTPNLKEAPMWGDFHFANALAASFERRGVLAGVDTADAWYSHSTQEDVVLAIRGRHQVKTDPSKINVMWVISHPDRIPEAEFADYDHIFVASDVYAKVLSDRGLPSVSVLHQATDHTAFRPAENLTRKAACLFVGNSRKEYRTAVKWCIQKEIPMELYGGGWDGILPKDMVRGTSVSNAELPGVYASHMLLLNDHWDSMRDNGFLSNRLFDGSGTATPILTDAVAGLADVFGDTISVANDMEHFAETIFECLSDPTPFLERAQSAHEIVMAGHTFDHRATEISAKIDQIAARRLFGK